MANVMASRADMFKSSLFNADAKIESALFLRSGLDKIVLAKASAAPS